MPEVLILEFSGVTEAEYASVNGHLGIDMHTGEGDWPPGLISHAAGLGDDGTFVVTEVWNSRADQAAFLERLGAALGRLGAALAAGGVADARGPVGAADGLRHTRSLIRGGDPAVVQAGSPPPRRPGR